MNNGYYMLPIPFQRIIERKDMAKCDLQTSIAQNIHLTLITSFGESRYNLDYGCLVWESDFENIYNLNGWKDKMIRSIAATLETVEKRLNNIQVALEITQEETDEKQKSKIRAIRKRLDIRVNGNLQRTNESFAFSEPIYISPIAFD